MIGSGTDGLGSHLFVAARFVVVISSLFAGLALMRLSRMIKPGTVSQGKASVIWRASHSAVGLVVTPIHRRRRRPSPKMTNTNSRSNVSVGTMRKSTDAMPSAWLRRKVFHPWDGGPRRLNMYFETVDWATLKPSLLAMNPRRAPEPI